MKFGFHISAEKHYEGALETLKQTEMTAAQMFITPPVQFKFKNNVPPQLRTQFEELGTDITIHAPYVFNLCNEGWQQKQNVEMMVHHLKYGVENLNAKRVVFHVGSHKEILFEKAVDNVVKTVAEALNLYGEGQVCLEHTPGRGTNISRDISVVTGIIDRLRPDFGERIALCLDTAHAYGAGYDLNKTAVRSMILDKFGPYIAVIHANDTKVECDSSRDVHCPIGTGNIGLKAWEFIAENFGDKNVPLICERGVDTTEEDHRWYMATTKPKEK